MSRQIDPENLSADDIEYIKQRPNLRQEFILQGYGDPVKSAEENPDDFDDSSTIDDLDNDSVEVEVEDDEDDYDNWKKDELVAEAEKRGVDASGTKDEIKARLRAGDSEG